jgi:hypothetical protein
MAERSIKPIELPSADEGANVWDFRGGAPGCLRGVLLRRPDAHPVWHDYLVSLCHLRNAPELPKADKWSEHISHEILIYALNPDVDPDPGLASTISVLSPVNLIHQFEALEDDQALAIFSSFTRMLADGRLNPDTDFQTSQRAALALLQKESAL